MRRFRRGPHPLGRASPSGAASAIASAGLAAASIAMLAYIVLVPTARAPLMATLGGSPGQPNFVATVSGNSLVVVPAALLTSDPRAIELWLIPSGPGARPHSLGLIQPGQPIRPRIPPELAARYHARCDARRRTLAAGRLAYWIADRAGHRQRQADEPLTTRPDAGRCMSLDARP